MGKKINIERGARYGKLTVFSEAERKTIPSGQKLRVMYCVCDCGNQTNVLLLHLLRGRTLSCGCIKKTVLGLSETPIGRAFRSMHQRCSPNYFEKHLYFEKGISVCDEWKNFNAFFDWAKPRFKNGLQLDRINNSLGYSPENCRFVSCKINANNRDNTVYVFYNKKKMPLMLAISSAGKTKHASAIRARIKRGWNPQLAIDAPVRSLLINTN